MKGKWLSFAAACAVLAAWGAVVQADPPPLTMWASQIGSTSVDWATGIAIDGSGNIYITGLTFGDLGGPNQGYADAFIVACDSTGTVQWMRQIGTSNDEWADGIAVDASGNSYITGQTNGDLGGPNQGPSWSYDAFIVACDSGGTVQWTRQIGSSHHDAGAGIAVDGSGNIYITGRTWGDLGGPNQGRWDAFLGKYDSAGTRQWTRQIGTSGDDAARGIAVDASGSIYITGTTWGDLGGPNQGYSDAFIVAYDSGGTQQWIRQIGSSDDDYAAAIAVDAGGNVYVAGGTYGDLGGPNQGDIDVFIAKYDSGGTVQWMRQIGSSDEDRTYDIAVDASGNSYITGRTEGDLAGPTQGLADAFIVAYDSGGTVQWIRQIGTSDFDYGRGIAVDASGNIYIAGYTGGNLGGPNQGERDAFIMAFGTTLATAGDATLDGCVDGLDYTVWSNNYRTGKWWEEGDFTGDGYVDGLDYVAWSSSYDVGCPATVPEPATLVLLGLGGAVLLRRRPAGRT